MIMDVIGTGFGCDITTDLARRMPFLAFAEFEEFPISPIISALVNPCNFLKQVLKP
jgi:hypothetical protein